MHTRRPWFAALLIVVGLVSIPSPAFADFTAFLGGSPTPTTRGVKGFAVGTGLVIVAFEFEYAHTNEDLVERSPALRTYMFNGLLQTPFPIARLQFYGTAGGGVYRETFDTNSETNVGVNVGGGVKMSLIGPLRLRFDYRVATLKGNARYPRPQRFYAGVNLKF